VESDSRDEQESVCSVLGDSMTRRSLPGLLLVWQRHPVEFAIHAMDVSLAIGDDCTCLESSCLYSASMDSQDWIVVHWRRNSVRNFVYGSEGVSELMKMLAMGNLALVALQ
jgi:hypothetical protein